MNINKIYRGLEGSIITIDLADGTAINVHELIVVDFDGAQNVSYRNTDVGVSVENIDVTASVSGADQTAILSKLNSDAAAGVLYISSTDLEKASVADDVLYSTIYVGETDDFDSLGAFSGIAETTGEAAIENKADNAFVITNGMTDPDALAEVIAHEAGHLTGTVNHDYGNDGTTLDDYAAYQTCISSGTTSTYSNNTYYRYSNSNVTNGAVF